MGGSNPLPQVAQKLKSPVLCLSGGEQNGHGRPLPAVLEKVVSVLESWSFAGSDLRVGALAEHCFNESVLPQCNLGCPLGG